MTVMTQTVARVLLLFSWMVAFAILVKGYVEAGDGFSAGVVASLGILIQYVAFGTDIASRILPLQRAMYLSAIGLLIALSVAVLTAIDGDPIMTHWPPVGEKPIYLGSLELISAFAFDIGVFLLVLGFCVGVIDMIAHAVGEIER